MLGALRCNREGVTVREAEDTIGALKLAMLFWGFLIILMVHYAPKPCSNYSGPYIATINKRVRDLRDATNVAPLSPFPNSWWRAGRVSSARVR